MSDILDDYKNSGAFTDHLYLQTYQVDPIVEKLNEHKIPHQVRPSKNLDDTGLVPLTAATKLSRPDFVIQIPNNLHFQVDELMEAHPELLHVSSDVRELFLTSSMDEKGWIEILIYPEEWEDGDEAIAQKLLTQKGGLPTTQELAERKKSLDVIRAKQKQKRGLTIPQIFFTGLLLLIIIRGIFTGLSFLGF